MSDALTQSLSVPMVRVAATVTGLLPAFVLWFHVKNLQLRETAKKGGPARPLRKVKASGHDPRDFVQAMKRSKKRVVIFYGSQTGTAENYAVRIAKEARSRFGLSPMVLDLNGFDFQNINEVPDNCALIFVMASYGEGEPTDNAVHFMDYVIDQSGMTRLENLNYVIFGLGNKTYTFYQGVARKLDARLLKMGARRIGERGEGDDDKSIEEDFIAWQEGMWDQFAKVMNVEAGQENDIADYLVQEISNPDASVYHGELSVSAANSGVSTPADSIQTYSALNPYPAPILACRDLFAVDSERECVHMEFDTTGTNITYEHGDHIGVWPVNPEVEVERMLSVLGLNSSQKRTTAVAIESLDPQLAKITFPTPATYEAIFRHYLDISAYASRSIVQAFAPYAPHSMALTRMKRWGSDQAAYLKEVSGPRLKIAEVLQAAAGDSFEPGAKCTVWKIPFDRILSNISRLHPRYYSISSSPRLTPTSIHVTAVVLKYQSAPSHVHEHQPRWVYGVASNFILNLKVAASGASTPAVQEDVDPVYLSKFPRYLLSGPRSAYRTGDSYRVPIHIRRSTFRLPTSPSIPVIMIGPGTGVAPFRGFVQERVAMARDAVRTDPRALDSWAPMYLFYGCRKSNEDYLYADEWPQYQRELPGVLKMEVAFSRETANKKVYVQHLLAKRAKTIASLILDRKAYVYICGDAKNMAKAVEDELAKMIGQAMGGSKDVEGAKEVRRLKDRKRILLDVWS